MLKLKNYLIAFAVSFLIAVLVHVEYDITSAMTSIDDIEFYVAFIGGGLTLAIYNNICNRIK